MVNDHSSQLAHAELAEVTEMVNDHSSQLAHAVAELEKARWTASDRYGSTHLVAHLHAPHVAHLHAHLAHWHAPLASAAEEESLLQLQSLLFADAAVPSVRQPSPASQQDDRQVRRAQPHPHCC